MCSLSLIATGGKELKIQTKATAGRQYSVVGSMKCGDFLMMPAKDTLFNRRKETGALWDYSPLQRAGLHLVRVVQLPERLSKRSEVFSNKGCDWRVGGRGQVW